MIPEKTEHIIGSVGIALLLMAGVSACGVQVESPGSSGNSPITGSDETDWLIPDSEIIVAQGKDGIPSIDDPDFKVTKEITFIPDERFILGVKVGEEVRGYPIQIMDWHEVVNDGFMNMNVAVTYCPLTGTGIAIDRGQTEYGVSGMLFRNNLIMYDRISDSKWSQMQLRAVQGNRKGLDFQLVDILQTDWKTWKKMYPNAQVLTTKTGYNRDYESYAYGHSLSDGGSASLFPVTNSDDRLSMMERVHGVIISNTADFDAHVKAYQIESFGNEIQVVNDRLMDTPVVVAGYGTGSMAVSFYSELDGTVLHFEALQDSLPLIMKDQEGNRWDVFGQAQSGPRSGQQLIPTKSYTGFWYAWADFFPNIELYTFVNENE